MARKPSATSSLSEEEAVRRGWFVVNGLKRIAGAEDPYEQLSKERLHVHAHKIARARREAAARMIDEAARVYGDKLGWYLGPNEEHCQVCISADGKNFKASKSPTIGYPSVVHPNCKCSPGAPFPNGTMMR